MPQPWEQREGEPAAAYARFLIYRNLGPGRTLLAAQTVARGATGRKQSQSITGVWAHESSEWEWVARSDAWDVAVISEIGARAAVRFVATLERMALKALEALDKVEVAPKDVKELVEVVRALGEFIPAEAFAVPRSVSADTTPPPERHRLAS